MRTAFSKFLLSWACTVLAKQDSVLLVRKQKQKKTTNKKKNPKFVSAHYSKMLVWKMMLILKFPLI